MFHRPSRHLGTGRKTPWPLHGAWRGGRSPKLEVFRGFFKEQQEKDGFPKKHAVRIMIQVQKPNFDHLHWSLKNYLCDQLHSQKLPMDPESDALNQEFPFNCWEIVVSMYNFQSVFFACVFLHQITIHHFGRWWSEGRMLDHWRGWLANLQITLPEVKNSELEIPWKMVVEKEDELRLSGFLLGNSVVKFFRGKNSCKTSGGQTVPIHGRWIAIAMFQCFSRSEGHLLGRQISARNVDHSGKKVGTKHPRG